MAKEKEPLPDFSDVVVKLKPIFGIKPSMYLPVVYLTVLILLIFLILILPGIVSHGSYVTFTSVPSKAIVSIDRTYIGATPITVFVKSGIRDIELRKPFYTTITVKEKIDGGIFGTLFFPLKRNLSATLNVEDSKGLAAYAVKDFAEFGMLREFTYDYQLPPILTDAVAAIYTGEEGIKKDLEAMLFNALMFVDSDSELWELVAALSTVETNGKPLHQHNFITLLRKIIQVKEAYENFPCWLSRCLSKRKFQTGTSAGFASLYDLYTGSPWFKTYAWALYEQLRKFEISEGRAPGQKSIVVNGIDFVPVPGALFLMGNSERLSSRFEPDRNDLPHKMRNFPFYISETEITNRQFKQFAAEKKEWLPSNRDALIQDELVTTSYLSQWSGNDVPSAIADIPVTCVSYHAAKAYCRWLTEKLDGFHSAARIRLPLESEWEWCAKKTEQDSSLTQFFPDVKEKGPHKPGTPDRSGIRDLFGNVWEWCDDWFFPAGYFFTSAEEGNTTTPLSSLEGAERVVRGGSWVNSREENIRSFTRGAQPPGWCTDYCGFRVVLSEY
jgi:iron(II)-dependent oxidoreductase